MSFNKWAVYIKPFTDDGVYSEYQDITDDVDLNSMSKISVSLDNTDFDIGVFRNSDINLALKNKDGRYSDIDNPKSIFKYKRADTLIKITWRLGNPPLCGIAQTGNDWFLGEEQTIFEGLLSDDDLEMDLSDQTIKFTVLGRESIFERVVVPFGSISNGDLISSIIYEMLNQSAITDILTVDALNIDPGIDQAIDSIASLQNKTVKEGLEKLLLATNSVLYINGSSVIVAPRVASAALQFTFYGPGAYRGNENTIALLDIKSAIARVINFATWVDTPAVTSENTTSRNRFGTRKKEFDFEFFTTSPKQQAVLDSIVEEFGDSKEELIARVKLKYASSALQMLDRVNLDYPYISVGETAYVFGASDSVAGVAVAALSLSQFERIPAQHYKIIEKTIEVKSSVINFRLRAI